MTLGTADATTDSWENKYDKKRTLFCVVHKNKFELTKESDNKIIRYVDEFKYLDTVKEIIKSVL